MWGQYGQQQPANLARSLATRLCARAAFFVERIRGLTPPARLCYGPVGGTSESTNARSQRSNTISAHSR